MRVFVENIIRSQTNDDKNNNNDEIIIIEDNHDHEKEIVEEKNTIESGEAKEIIDRIFSNFLRVF